MKLCSGSCLTVPVATDTGEVPRQPGSHCGDAAGAMGRYDRGLRSTRQNRRARRIRRALLHVLSDNLIVLVEGSSKSNAVDPRRFELLTSSMRTRRATNCAKGPQCVATLSLSARAEAQGEAERHRQVRRGGGATRHRGRCESPADSPRNPFGRSDSEAGWAGSG